MTLFQLVRQLALLYRPINMAVWITQPRHNILPFFSLETQSILIRLGITLLIILSKVFTGIINKRLVSWGEAMDKISESQADFRNGYTTVDNMFILQSVRKYQHKRW